MTRLIVTFKEWRPGEIPDVLAACGAERIPDKVIPQLRMIRAFAPKGADPATVVASLVLRPEVERAYVEPKLTRSAVVAHGVVPNDPLFQWHHVRVATYSAHRHTTGSPLVKQGNVDEGALIHPDVAWPAGGYNVVLDIPDPTSQAAVSDDGNTYTHGLATQAMMAAKRDNGIGVFGMAPGCPFYAVSDYAYDGVFQVLADCLEGYLWHADNGTRVINHSEQFYKYKDDPSIADVAAAAEYCRQRGANVIVAAGNATFNFDANGYVNVAAWASPGLLLAVGAIDRNDLPASFSNYGSRIDITAPGMGLTNVGAKAQEYQIDSQGGTSFSAPMVAGACSLVVSTNPALTPVQVRDIIVSTASEPIASARAAYRAKFPNAGVLCAGAAVAKARSTLPENAGVAFPFILFLPIDRTTVSNGVETVTLDGPVEIDVRGYADGADVPRVVLDLGGTTLYDGPPARLTGMASSSGTAQPLTIRAYTAAGAVSEETYSNVVVSSLSLGADLSLATAHGFDTSAGVSWSASEGIGSATVGHDSDAEARPGYYLARNLSLGRSWVAGPYAQIPIYGGDIALGTTQGYASDAVSAQVGAAILAATLAHGSDAVSAQVAATQFNAAQGFSSDATALAALLGDAAFAAGASFVTDAVTGHVVALTLGTGHALVLDAGYQDALNASAATSFAAALGATGDAVYRGPDLVADSLLSASLGLDSDARFGPRYDAEQSVDALLAFATDARFAGTPAVVYPPFICTLPDLTVIATLPDLAIVHETPDLTFIADSAEDSIA